MCQSNSGANMPGSGGVNRGRGDAELTWGEESEGDTRQFELQVLPSAELEDLTSSGLLGVGRGAPTVEPKAEGAGSAGTTQSTGKAAWRRRLSPSHRRAVRTFFSKED